MSINENRSHLTEENFLDSEAKLGPVILKGYLLFPRMRERGWIFRLCVIYCPVAWSVSNVKSLEKGVHTDLRFTEIEEIL